MAIRRLIIGMAAAVALITVAVYFGTGNLGFKGTLFKQAMPLNYFELFNSFPPTLERVTKNVYSFRVGFNRGLVINTDEGFINALDCRFTPNVAALRSSCHGSPCDVH